MSDFNINIKQTRSGDSAKETLQDLKSIKAEAPAATKAAGEGFESMGRKINASRTIAEGFARAAKGDLTGLLQVGNGLRMLWTGLGSAIAVAGAGFAGWKIGERIREFLWLKLVTSQVGEEFESVGTRARRARAEIAKLAQEKLDKIKAEIESTVEALRGLDAFKGEEAGRKEAVFQARHQLRRAAIEAETQEGPERTRALAEEDAAYTTQKADQTIARTTETIENANAQKAAIDTQIQSAQSEYESAKTDKTRTGPAREQAAKKRLDELSAMRPEIGKKATRDIYQAESERDVAYAEKETGKYTRASAMTSANAEEARQAADAEAEAAQEDIEGDRAGLSESKEALPGLKSKLQSAIVNRQHVVSEVKGKHMEKTASGHAEISNADKSVQEANAALQSMVKIVQDMAEHIKQSESQMKNSSRRGG